MHRVFAVVALPAVIWVAALSSIGAAQAPDQPRSVPASARKLKADVPSSPEAIEAGRGLFAKYCRACHGEDGRGGKPSAKGVVPSNLADRRWDRGGSEGQIFWVVQNGAPPAYHMRGFKGTLSDENIWKVVHYVRSLGAATR